MDVFILLILTDMFIAIDGWPCESHISKVFIREKENAVLNFHSDLENMTYPRTFFVRFYDGNLRAYISYNKNRSYTSDALPGVTIKGDTLGHVIVTLENAKHSFAGTYYMESVGLKSGCTCLYILGIPTTPIINYKSITSVGGNTTLTCASTSTTQPSNHSLSLIYNWRVDNSDNATSTKFIYSSRSEYMLINFLTKDDAKKQFTCTATEDVDNGYTSLRSDPISIDIYYGPDTADINVESPYYVNDGDIDISIECAANCHPTCSYEWTNLTDGSILGTSSWLRLNTVESYTTGGYTCTAKRTDTHKAEFAQKTVIIIVNGKKNNQTITNFAFVFELICGVLGAYAIFITVLLARSLCCRGIKSHRKASSKMTNINSVSRSEEVNVQENINRSHDNGIDSCQHYSDLEMFNRDDSEEYDVIMREGLR